MRIVAAAVGIPATRFLSASPDGMNATGESDLVNYIDLLKGLQTSIFDPRLQIVDRIIQAHLGIPEWEYEWNSIFPESNVDRSKRAKDTSDSLSKLVEMGIITPQAAHDIIVHEKLFGEIDLGVAPPHPPMPPTPPNNNK